MADYIYCRVSTSEQTVDSQLIALKKLYPNAEVISETASGASQRPMLKALIERLGKDDRLIVAALDRIGRRALDLLQTMEHLEKKGVIVKSIRENIDYQTPIGKFVTQILSSVAEMERNLIRERTKAGVAAARRKGKHPGRPITLSKKKIDHAIKLVTERGYSLRKAAKKNNISPSYLGRIIKTKIKRT